MGIAQLGHERLRALPHRAIVGRPDSLDKKSFVPIVSPGGEEMKSQIRVAVLVDEQEYPEIVDRRGSCSRVEARGKKAGRAECSGFFPVKTIRLGVPVDVFRQYQPVTQVPWWSQPPGGLIEQTWHCIAFDVVFFVCFRE
jgi:hypothetical protein